MSGMFTFMADIAEQDKDIKAGQEALKELFNNEVLIGIPEEGSGREDEVSNAQLLYIHTNGSPINGIPARPVIEAALEHDKEQVSQLLENAAKVAASGNTEGVHTALDRAGIQGQNIARAWFTNPANGWAPNKPETVANKTPAIRNIKKRARKAKSTEERKALYAEAREAAKNTKATPLIDTAEMRKSITYKVEHK